MKTEKIIINEEKNVTLTAYTQDVEGEFHNIAKRPAILVLPGGGYHRCSDREADPVAFAYLQKGFQVFILRYTVVNVNWPQPLEDYEKAMEIIKSRADEWHIYTDKIAVIGFSAGGHLAASAATSARNKPAAAILSYPLTTNDVKHYLADAPSACDRVDENTCPCFLFHTANDEIVPVKNTLEFAAALNRSRISFEVHIYNYGPHGFSTADTSVLYPTDNITPRACGWVEDSIAWLRDILGDFGKHELTEPKCKTKLECKQHLI